MKILITGATGLLGAHLSKIGLEKGHDLTCVGRSISKRSYLATVEDKLNFLAMDLTDPEQIKTLPTDFDLVIHCAALASAKPEDAVMMQALNVDATKNLSQHLPQVRWVQVSSVSVMSDGSSETIDESFFGKCRETFYAKTKLESDKYLEGREQSPLFIHPCYLLGAWDARPSSGAVLMGLKFAKFTCYLEGMKNFVAAEDVARGMFQAVEQNKTGRYLLGGENSSIENFMKVAEQKLQLKKSPLAMTLEQMNKDENLRAQVPFVREFCLSNAVSCEKAKKEFGYSPQLGLEQMIDQCLDYFSAQKMLRIKRP